MIEADVAVVGGGIAGVSVACHLARLGHAVALLERDAVASHASGLNGGQIGATPRRGGPDLESRLGAGSLEIFRSLQLDLGHDIELRQSGGLRVIRTEAELAYARELAAPPGAEPGGLRLLTVREARAIEPGLDPALLGVLHAPLDAQANPVKATRALAAEATAAGARILTGHEVTSLASRADGTYGLRAGKMVLAARTLVIAAGPWSRRVGAMLGLDVPIVPVRGQMWATESLPPRLFHNLTAMESALHWRREPGGGPAGPPRLTHRGPMRLTRHLYGRQTRDGAIVFGGDRELADVPVPEPAGVAVNHAHAAEIVPFLHDLPIRRTWAGLMPFSLDGRPLIGPVPSRPNLYLLGGLASSGFGEGPMAGRLLAEWIHTSVPPPMLGEATPAGRVRER